MRHLFTCAAHSVSRSDRCVLQPSASTVDPGRQCAANAHVHSSVRQVHFALGAACRRGEAACLPKAWRRQASCDAAIAANLKELGYGG